MSEMVKRVARAMQESKAWPAVFSAATAEELARASIAAMSSQQDKWQPIETAPMNETKVLLYGGVEYAIGWHMPGYTLSAWVMGYDDMGAMLFCDATDWQPLPEPPK